MLVSPERAGLAGRLVHAHFDASGTVKNEEDALLQLIVGSGVSERRRQRSDSVRSCCCLQPPPDKGIGNGGNKHSVAPIVTPSGTHSVSATEKEIGR